jgi:predicted metal-dependent peptidase
MDKQQKKQELKRIEKASNYILDRISQSRTKLLGRLPFFGRLALKLRPRLSRPSDGVNTAAVGLDGSLIVDADFAKSLTDSQLCFVVCHEVLHPAMLYFERMQGRIPQLWNMAHDYAINLIIKQMGDNKIELIKDCLCDNKYIDWSAEEIYDDLLKDATMVSFSRGEGEGGGTSMPGRGEGNDPTKDPLNGDGRQDIGDSEDGKKANNGDKGAKTRIETDWKISIVAAAQTHEQSKGRGSLPSQLQRLVDEITEPKVDWREQLSRWVGENGRKQDYTYSRPSRRSESVGQYLPSLKNYGFAPVTVMVDTSGSIGSTMLKEGLSEIQGVCEDLGLGVRAMIIDADLHADIEVADAYELAENLSGGGGSNFNPAFEKLQEEGYDGVVIAFTDGDICVPTLKPEHIRGVLWCLYEDCTPPTNSWGETVMIPRSVTV